MNQNLLPVALDKCYRLINHGPAVLLSAVHDGVVDVMAVSWACALDFAPPKVTVVLDKATRTRALVEQSGMFAVQVPTAVQAGLTLELGSRSLHDDPAKLEKSGVQLFELDGHAVPLVDGCSAWLLCRLVPEPHNQQTYDLFIGEVVAAWADDRVFRDGHWHFDSAPADLRSLHYIAGGHFYAIGEAITVPVQP